MQHKNHKKSKKLIIVVLLAILAIALIGGTVYFIKNSGQKTNSYDDGSGINYEPPTEEEKQAGDKQKDKIIQEEDARNNPNSQDEQTASVIITDAGQYDDVIEVRAFIPDHYQDGTCTITLTQGSYKVTKDTPAYRDVSTTICTNPLFTRSEFANNGEWHVVVSYSSEGATGTSEPRTVNIK